MIIPKYSFPLFFIVVLFLSACDYQSTLQTLNIGDVTIYMEEVLIDSNRQGVTIWFKGLSNTKEIMVNGDTQACSSSTTCDYTGIINRPSDGEFDISVKGLS